MNVPPMPSRLSALTERELRRVGARQRSDPFAFALSCYHVEARLGLGALPPRVGHYELQRRLGQGGMGAVYLAHDLQLDRPAALKCIQPSDDPTHQVRLEREALAMARVDHPNVIDIYRIGEHEGSTYIAMEYVEGQTLRDWLKGPCSQRERLTAFKAAGRGLAAAHQRGLVHRDFKPDNVMIDASDHVRVLDFGLAWTQGEELGVERPLAKVGRPRGRGGGATLTRTGAILGTPAYMSPEQFQGRATTAASDQFSFCIALYEALYGERPFAADTREGLVEAVTKGLLREPPVDAQVPAWLRELVCRGLAPEPRERHASMQALLSTLVVGELEHDEDGREPPSHVVVLYDPRDRPAAQRLCEDLLSLGVRPWIDLWELEPGADWSLRLEAAILEAPALLSCHDPRGASYYAAVRARERREPATVYRAILPSTVSPPAPGGATRMREASWPDDVLALARRVGVDRERSRWLAYETGRGPIAAESSSAGGVPTTVGALPDQGRALSPYRGLEPFREAHARWLFGRSAEVSRLLAALERGERFVTLVGASGSGKSSLLMAGLCPALRCGALGARDWSVAYLRPGARPCEALARALATHCEGAPSAAALLDNPASLLSSLSRREGRLLLVIDQLEELFTMAGLDAAAPAREARAFVANLVEATQPQVQLDSRVWVVASLRADFLQPALQAGGLGQVMRESARATLATLDAAQVRATIERPLARVGYRIEPALVDKLVLASSEPGRLPLLQYVLGELWERRDETHKTLRAAVYEELGGLEGALAATAERTLDQLRLEHGARAEPAVRQLMTRLVHVSPGNAPFTRRPVPVAELAQGALATRVREAFVVEARVLVLHRDTMELAHEKLVQVWDTLRGWLEDDRRALALREEIAADAQRYAAARDREFLWDHERLGLAREILAGSSVLLGPREDGFLRAGERAARARRSVGAAVVVGLLVAAAVVVVVVLGINGQLAAQDALLQEQIEAIAAGNVALDRERRARDAALAADIARIPGNEIEALVTAVGAYEPDERDVPEAVFTGLTHALESVRGGLGLLGHERELHDLAYSPDGATLVTASADGSLRVWDANTAVERTRLDGHEGPVLAVDFSPDGTRIASAGRDGSARVWDLSAESSPVVLRPEGPERTTVSALHDVAFGPDGALVITASHTGQATVWSTASGEALLVLDHDHPVRAARFSEDGTQLITADEGGQVQLWDATTGERRGPLVGHTAPVRGLALSPDGTLLASASEDETVRVWDLVTGEARSTLAHGQVVYTVAFSPDGELLATGTFDDETGHLWELATERHLRSFPHEGPVVGVAFSPSGRHLSTASWDGSGRVWGLDPSPALVELEGHGEPIYDLELSPDGRHLATAGGDNDARWWDAATWTPRAVLRGHDLDLDAVAFSPDSSTLATAGWDGVVRLWRTDPEGDVDVSERALVLGKGRIRDLAFMPGGEGLVLARDVTKTAEIWSTAGAYRDEVLELEAPARRVEVSPEGGHLLALDEDGALSLWALPLTEDEPERVPTISAAAFSPGDTHLALAGRDNRIQLRALTSPTSTAAPALEGHTGPVIGLAFSPDGRRLASLSEDDSVRVWDLASGETIVSLPRAGALDLLFSAQGDQLITAGREGRVRVHDLRPHTWYAWGCSALSALDVDTLHSPTRCADLPAPPEPVAGHRGGSSPRVILGPTTREPSPGQPLTVHGVELVYIPGGRFLMGSSDGEGMIRERPRHEVELDGFYLARTEVTNAQYARYLEANPGAPLPAFWDDERFNQPEQPVVGISWFEAMAYCDWAGLTLPTEAQWEYATRGGERALYWFGDEVEDLARFAWVERNANGRPHRVGTKDLNGFGFHDVAGNVGEWVQDRYGSYSVAPRMGDGLRYRPSGRVSRVERGGSW
ncbi:WD-40 repeat, partial [Plesiocystis pacifica SIR-1]